MLVPGHSSFTLKHRSNKRELLLGSIVLLQLTWRGG